MVRKDLAYFKLSPKLRAALEAKTQGVEVVRLSIRAARPEIPTSPIWPDDEITRDWLGGIAAAREAADSAPDPWDDQTAADQT